MITFTPMVLPLLDFFALVEKTNELNPNKE
jgi:hypothetical protein